MTGLFSADTQNRGLVLDPRTKLAVMLSLVVFTLGGTGSHIQAVRYATVILSILPFALHATAGRYKKAVVLLCLFALVKSAETWLVPQLSGVLLSIMSVLCMLFVRLMPSLSMGSYMLCSTTVSEFLAAMLPQLIVLDEPTSNLDLDAIDELKQILVMWKKQGKTIIIAEHRLGWLEGVCDRVLFMQQGSVKEEFPAHDFFSLTTEQLNSRGLRAVRTKTNYLETQTGITALAEPETHGTIRLENYHYSYSGQDAVHIDALDIPKGGVIAVVGHNGAGKSTFIRCLCGLQKGFKGRTVIDGKRLKPKQMLALSYMVMQDVNHQLFTDTVLDEVMLSAGDDDKQKAMQLLEKLNIAQFADRHPMSLSGGQKQRTAIASALTAGKNLLVFDEPTSGLDFAGMQCSAELIHSLGTDVTVLIVTHDMEFIQRCCTHVLHIENGSI